jgi:hypothetical protein
LATSEASALRSGFPGFLIKQISCSEAAGPLREVADRRATSEASALLTKKISRSEGAHRPREAADPRATAKRQRSVPGFLGS